jgi:hypothetical protein
VTGVWTPTIDFRTAPAAAQSAGVYLNVHELDDAGSLDALIEEIVS